MISTKAVRHQQEAGQGMKIMKARGMEQAPGRNQEDITSMHGCSQSRRCQDRGGAGQKPERGGTWEWHLRARSTPDAT